jgi:hypothetical protein
MNNLTQSSGKNMNTHMDGVHKIKIKYSRRRKELVAHGSIFRYSDKNLDKVVTRQDPKNLLYHKTKHAGYVRPLELTLPPYLI